MMLAEHRPYVERRDTIRTYFDRTALDAWKKFASDKPLGRVRETVRQGRETMRAELLSRFPMDLQGWRILDAGCGAGHLALALANRGADVVGVDLSPEIVAFARDGLPKVTGGGSLDLRAGDMLATDLGSFDGVVAMDSVIHYGPDMTARAIEALAERVSTKIVFSVAPRTPMLALMRASAGLFPRGDRAPLIEPVVTEKLANRLHHALSGEGWRNGRRQRVTSGFYISEAMEVARHG